MSDTTEDCKPQDTIAGVRVVTLHLPEDEGEGLGFKLTRTIWDPYPWVREVTTGQRADVAGLRSGDCLLQADGKDLLGLPVGQVAGVIRGDGGGHGVSLLVWSCGSSPQDDPELLWSAGGGARGERSRRALSGVLRALACCVCSATAASPRARTAQCARGHIYCAGCRARLQRCALCRETLPPLDSPHARSLVAEQVFEAIASVYELGKDSARAPNTSVSCSSSPARSPTPSTRTPQASVSQRNSPSCLRKTVQFGLSAQPHHGSDSSLNRPKPNMPEFSLKRLVLDQKQSKGSQTDLRDLNSPVVEKSALFWRENSQIVNPNCQKRFSNPGCCQMAYCSEPDACQRFSSGKPDRQTSTCNGSSDFECCQNSGHYVRQTSSENVSKFGQNSSENENCRNSSEGIRLNLSENRDSECQTSSERKICKNSSDRCCLRSSERCCQRSSERCCQPSSERCCQPSSERCCQRSSERCCQRSSQRKCCQNSPDPHYCQSAAPKCCPVNTQNHHGELPHQLLHQGLNLVPLSAVPGLQHRLVARLRPASSLADLRPRSQNAEGLSKSWNNIHSGESASGERSESMSDLPSPDISAGDEVFVMSAQAPVLVWAYQQ